MKIDNDLKNVNINKNNDFKKIYEELYKKL